MTQATIAANLFKPLNIGRYITTKLTLDTVLLLDYFTKLIDDSVNQIVHPGIRIDLKFGQNFIGPTSTNTLDVRQGNLDSFVR